MISPASLEEGVLALLCFSTEQASLLSLKITETKFFSNQTNQKIAQAAIDYITKFGSPPKGQLEYILESDLMRGEAGKLLGKTIENLSKRINEIQPEFILGQLDQFLENQKLTHNLQQALEHLQEGDNEGAKELIYKSQAVSQNGSSGLWMKDIKQALRFFDRDELEDYFTSGVEVLDYMGFRPERKTFIFIVAAAKKGKSWFLVNIGKGGLQYHKKVLHITLEISEERTARRYIQSIFSLTKHEATQLKLSYFDRDENNNVTIQFRELQREGIFNKKKELQDKLNQWISCPDWIIKEFPTAFLSTEQLEMYLDSLEQQRGFKPDLLIIDYADLMKIDSASLRIDTGRLYRELRGIAVRHNLALVSASQGNRESEDAKVVRVTNIAEDWSKIGTADGVLTYSQTEEEYKLGLARLFAAATREEQGRYMVLISQAYQIGQFATDSVMMNAGLINEIQRVGGAK